MARSQFGPYWSEIVAIIEGGLAPDPGRVAAYASHLADRLEQDGENRLAKRIRGIHDKAAMPAGSLFLARSAPTDIEAQMSLVEERSPEPVPLFPALPTHIEHEIHRFIELVLNSDKLAARGVDPPSSLLLYGPAGTGKTMAAHAIASSLGLPLLTVRLDSLLGSFLGNSGKNLRRVFESAQSQPSILFLDEFDAIAKMRDDHQEVGEIKRLVSSLLQHMDSAQGRLIVIAATNHETLLDTAVWRRFDVALQFPFPGLAERAVILNRMLRDSELNESSIAALAAISDGFSGADIVADVVRSLQNWILTDGRLGRLLASAFFKRCSDASPTPEQLDDDNLRSLVSLIHGRSGSTVGVRQIAQLLDCSAPHVSRIIKMEATDDRWQQ